MEFWNKHFDKILASLLFLITLGAFLHIALNGKPEAVVLQVLSGVLTTVLGMLGVLLTGRLLTGTKAPNGNSSQLPNGTDKDKPAA